MPGDGALLRMTGQSVVLNVDGLAWKRKKWGWFERWATRFPPRVVTDSSERLSRALLEETR